MIYTISARSKPQGVTILNFLAESFPAYKTENIDSVFAFVEKSTLYGGRPFVREELSPRDVESLYASGIGLRLPLTNHYVSRDEYLENRLLLDKYHRKGNSVIITNDDLARWIRDDFPLYRIEASVIKNINSHEKIESNLKLYDTVVLPMSFNTQHNFLKQIVSKDQITLFANAGCALTCPAKICYPSISKANKFKGDTMKCSYELKDRTMFGMLDFNLKQLSSFGFTRFKVLRSAGPTGY